MTKPADSDQIARTKERSVIFFKVWLSKQPATWQQLSLDDFWLAFAASERQAVIEECCRAVCAQCKRGEVATFRRYLPDNTIDSEMNPEGWFHDNGTNCDAAAIRSME